MSKYYNRIMFPFFNPFGELVGYQGRLYEEATDVKAPKYLNTVFEKSNLLYGLFENRELITKMNFCVLVEGVFDVISLWEIGIPAVASIGVNFTSYQAFLLRCLTTNIGLWYDNDPAGEQGSRLVLDKCKAFDLKVEWQNDGLKDPNAMLVEEGEERLKKVFWT